MAMSSVIRIVSPAVVPLAVRAIASPRILDPSFIPAPTAAEHGGDVRKESFIFPHHSHFSTVTDHALRQVDQRLTTALMNSQIKPNSSDIKMPEVPTGFPFEIQDNPNELEVKLTRQFGGEKIVVYVYDPIYPKNWSVDNNGDGGDNVSSIESSDDEEHETKSITFEKPRIQVTVNIYKESRTSLRIYLWANVGYVGHPEVFIDDKMRLPNEMSFDKEDYWREFIRARGIDDSIGKFMMDYMNRRKARNHLLFWKKVKNFMEAEIFKENFIS